MDVQIAILNNIHLVHHKHMKYNYNKKKQRVKFKARQISGGTQKRTLITAFLHYYKEMAETG